MELENKQEFFPDGTPVDGWFYDLLIPKLEDLGKQYVLTSYGILDDGKIHTAEIQAVMMWRTIRFVRPESKVRPVCIILH